MLMRPLLAAALASSVPLAAPAYGQNSETKETLESLPAAVKEAEIVSMAEQKSLSEIPVGARDAIKKAVGAVKLVRVEKVTKGEAQVLRRSHY